MPFAGQPGYGISMGDTVNHRVKLLRKELALTQREFSAIIRISPGQLACIETEKRMVNSRTLKLISDSFNVNPEWLRIGQGPVFETGAADNKNAKLTTLFNGLKPEYQDFILNSISGLLKIQEES